MVVVVAGEGALLALVPPLCLELDCDDGWSNTSPVGRAGCGLVPGDRGSLALENRETQALPVLWLQRTKTASLPRAVGSGLAASLAQSKNACFSLWKL